MSSPQRFGPSHSWLRAFAATLAVGVATLMGPAVLLGQVCTNTVTANVVALDQLFFYNRLGAHVPHGMIYALERDIVPIDPLQGLIAGNVKLRDDKRPRPLTLRVNAGDCLQVNFRNLLAPAKPWADQPSTREASFRVIGMQLVGSIASDGSNVGKNTSSLVSPHGSAQYTLYAEREGTYMAYSGGAQTGGEGDGGSLAFGLFGAVNVEPAGSEWYRSQLTFEEMELATTGTTPGGQPILNYDVFYPATHVRAGGASDVPILKMTNAYGEIVHSDLTAVITGPGRGWLRGVSGAWGSQGLKDNCSERAYPANTVLDTDDGWGSTTRYRSRCEPFREFTIIFHDEIKAIQAFNDVYLDPVLGHTLHSVRDGFAINYGTGGIGSEILANRLGLGPMANCNDCKYEEFFLTSWAVGDPAMVVDVPAWQPGGVTGVANKALYPDDPSNVYHSYLNDHVKIRNLHVGPKEHHIFHLHAHQWVNTPDSDESSYLDSQAIGPGSGYTYDITYNGSGNRPKTPGDAIFHCHFYPHFAQGMWALWRNHDTFEAGTELDLGGVPVSGARVLPDGEIAAGTPTPAVVPLPLIPMAPIPTADLPGFPFFIPAVAGHRPPQPALDFAPNPTDGDNGLLDGGLPRNIMIDDGVDVVAGEPVRTAQPAAATVTTSLDNIVMVSNGSGLTYFPVLNRLDFSKDNVTLNALELPHEGTPLEQNAMEFHAQRTHDTWIQPSDGMVPLAGAGPNGKFVTNGLPGVPGAPFADPCIDDQGGAAGSPLLYKGSAYQIDAAYTKNGWHFPQHRMLGLNADVAAVMSGDKPAEPFFFRANTNHCIEFQLTNLLPKEYALDDFQVLTPTDIMGQHIHLVKFDVMASDGSANGFNYEDGSLSPQEVMERISAINALGGIHTIDDVTGGIGTRRTLSPELHPYFGGVPEVTGNKWGNLALGAQSTVQRWFADDVKDRAGEDRTLRTVFTHDHFAPSTQQQAGYYAGLLVEPRGSQWLDNETGAVFGPPEAGSVTPADAGYAVAANEQAVTSWQAIIDMRQADPTLYPDRQDLSYREFMFEYQDMQLAYTAQSDNTFKPAEHNGVQTEGIFDVNEAINPPARVEVGLPLLTQVAELCPGGVPRPCPEAISADDPGIMTVNYRAEPIALRVVDPNAPADANGAKQQAQGASGVQVADADGNPVDVAQGDLSFAFVSGQLVRSDNPDCKGRGPNAACPPIRTPDAPVSGVVNNFDRAHDDMDLPPEMWPFLSLGDTPGRQYARGPLQEGALPGDPITPLLRGYAGDRVQVRQLVGAHEEGHNFSIRGVRWLFEPSWLNSGYRSSQMAGISEHFEFELPGVSPVEDGYPWEDYLYKTGAATDDLWAGAWGLIRSYTGSITGTGDLNEYGALATLPNNPKGDTPPFANATEFNGVCPANAPSRNYSVFALRAADLDPDGLIYNSRTVNGGPLTDPNAILFVREDDVVFGKGQDKDKVVGLRAGIEPEPLILRANAGDCINLKIERNMLPAELPEHDGFSTLPLVVADFNNNELTPSSNIGIGAQLVEYDMHQAEGANVGWNGIQTLAPGAAPPKGRDAVKFEPVPGDYRWYAGSVFMCSDLDGDGLADGPIDDCVGKANGWRVAVPMEFGAVALMSSDPIKHAAKGAIGALVIEPTGATWLEDGFDAGKDGLPGTPDDVCAAASCSRASASVTYSKTDPSDNTTATETFRDFVLLFQDDVNLLRGDGTAVPNLADSEDPEDSGQKGFNFNTEPMWLRLGFAPDAPLEATTNEVFTNAVSNAQVGGDPETPVFTADAGTPVRFRVVQSGGHARNHVFQLHGHAWQQLPWINESSEIGENRRWNEAPVDGEHLWATEIKGSQEGIGPTSHFNFVPLTGAGGKAGVTGDYLFRDMASFQFDGGLWGILRVCSDGTGNSGNTECQQ